MTGEKIASATSPPRYGQTESSQRRSFGTVASQITIAGPKNSAVYFDSNAAPTAAPTASHQAPRPVSSTFARKNNTKLEATSSGASGVTIRVPTAAISVTFSSIVAVAATRMPPNRIAAARYTAKLIGSASRIDTRRTPSSVSPRMAVPRRITKATIGG
jgi:hypothetical protein